MTTNYRSGSSVEYRIIKLFQSWGYEARRTAGSHGPFDVIAINSSEVVLIQAKKYKGKYRPGFGKDVNKLASVVAPPNVQKFLAIWQEGKGWDVWIDVKSDRVISWRNPILREAAKQEGLTYKEFCDKYGILTPYKEREIRRREVPLDSER